MVSCLASTKISKYPHSVVKIISELGADCVYVSYNKIPKQTKKLLAEEGLDGGKVGYINCVKVDDEDTTVDPEALTTLTVTIEDALEGLGGDAFILIDSLPAFTAYHKINTIMKFVGALNAEMEERDTDIIWLTLDDESERELNEKVGPLCDKVTEI